MHLWKKESQTFDALEESFQRIDIQSFLSMSVFWFEKMYADKFRKARYEGKIGQLWYSIRGTRYLGVAVKSLVSSFQYGSNRAEKSRKRTEKDES